MFGEKQMMGMINKAGGGLGEVLQAILNNLDRQTEILEEIRNELREFKQEIRKAEADDSGKEMPVLQSS